MKTLLSGAVVFINGGFIKKDVLIEDGVIVSLSEPAEKKTEVPSVSVIDYSDKYIFPGFVDVHVHFREPGFLYKEDVASGSMAAAKGGYTHVFTMPNLNPVPDSVEHMDEELKAIHDKAVVKVYPYASITMGEKGEKLVDFEKMTESFETLAGFSDDGTGVEDREYMLEAMERVASVGGIISAHCETKSLLGGKNVHDGIAAKALGITGISSESEWSMIKRDIELCRRTGCRYHVCHVSCAESIELIRQAKAEGVNITCETGPHYLLLSDRDLAEVIENGSLNGVNAKYGIGRFKMNPPLRSEKDRLALTNALKDGTIDMIATDHAPHSTEEKNRGLEGPMGVVGLECAFPVLYTFLVKKGIITLEKLISLLSTAPTERFGINHGKNGIAVGMPADITVFDLKEEYIIDPDTFSTKGRFTPFDGFKVYGRCIETYIDGQPRINT